MPRRTEIVTSGDLAPESESHRGLLLQINHLIHVIKYGLEPKNPSEILLSTDELKERIATLNVLILETGEKTVKLDKNKFCRVHVLMRQGRSSPLEFRIGSKHQVNGRWFSGLTDLDALIQVHIGLDGDIFSATLANLDKQKEALIGSGEYDTFGTVYGQIYYQKNVDAVGTVTENGLASFPLTDSIKDNALQQIFRPVQKVIWQLTEGLPARKAKKTCQSF